MDKFVVTGIPAFNGDYPVDISSFTMRELQIIKRMSGVRAGELEEAFKAGDTDLLLAIAVIAVRRNGKQWEAFEKLAWESDVASITFEGEEVAEEADPLTQTLPDEDGKSSVPPLSSGPSLRTVGDGSQETTQQDSGSPVSAAV